MIFYEPYNTDTLSAYSIYTVDNLNWGIHFHRAFECIIVLEGDIVCQVSSSTIRVHKGEAVFVMPNQIHSIESPDSSKILIARFHPELVQHFYKQHNGQLPSTNLFQIKNIQVDLLLNTKNFYIIKGILYELCGVFEEQTTFSDDKTKDNPLTTKMFKYVEDNYCGECNLEKLSEELGYEYTYLSKSFKKCSSISFVNYVNQRRVMQACILLRDTDQSVISIANSCGFSSLRTFNRNFHDICHCTPIVYRNRKNV